MRTTVTVATKLVERADYYKNMLNLKTRGEAFSWMFRNADSYIQKWGLDAFLMPVTVSEKERIYQESTDSSLYRRPLVWRLWAYCLDKVESVKSVVFINTKISVTLEAGSLLTSRSRIIDETGLTDENVREALPLLEEAGMIRIVKHPKPTVEIIIINVTGYKKNFKSEESNT